MKIYHNSRCRKSRSGLQYLENKGVKPEVVEYLKDHPFSESELKDVLRKLKLAPTDIIRTQEADYKQNYRNKEFSNDQWIKILVENPKLIQRPIIVEGEKAVLGDPIENIDQIL